MPVSINHATPRFLLPGIKDDSVRALVAEQLAFPQHLPVYYFQAERGRTEPQWITSGLTATYGAESFNPRGKFYSHQSVAMEETISKGNMILAERLVAPGAKASSLVLFLEMVKKTSVPYLRNADGSVVVDLQGTKQEDTSAAPVAGYLLRYSVGVVPDGTPLHALPVTSPGTLVGDPGEVSTIYPIYATVVDSVGKYGDNIGMRFSFPHELTNNPGDVFTMNTNRVNIYRAAVVERANAISSPQVRENLDSEQFTDFAFGEGTINPRTTRVYEESSIIEAYQDLTEGQEQVYGLFGEAHAYNDNIELITKLLGDIERTQTGDAEFADAQYNFLSGVAVDGTPHHASRFAPDSLTMNSITTHYASGGSDGDVSEATLDELVYDKVTFGWTNPLAPMVDRLRYPISAVYDTGFSLRTKQALLSLMAVRADIYVTCVTQDLAVVDNDVATETAMLSALSTFARLIPESTLFGTGTCRAMIYGSTGIRKSGTTNRRLPMLMEIIGKRAAYSGAGDGRMKNEFAYDRAPLNRVTTMTNVTNTFKSAGVRESDWNAGLNSVQYADAFTLFWPAFQTVHENDTSVLNSELTVMIAVDVTKKAEIVWTLLTGDTTLTREEFVAKSNQLMNDLVFAKYDGRVVIEVNTYFSAADDARGYSWVCESTIFANVQKTVGVGVVRTARLTDIA